MSSWSLEASVTSPPSLQVTVVDIEANDERKLTSRNWMEHNESLTGPGAYDVLRIDLTYDAKSDTLSNKIWGLQYHLNRLKMSFRELVKGKHESNSIDDDRILDTAVVQSKLIIDGLVSRSNTYYEQLSSHQTKMKIMQRSIMMKVTLFWTVSDVVDGKSAAIIIVRGHASTDGRIPHQKPDFIRTSLALPPPHESDDGEVIFKLPNRLDTPHAKISSWLLQRKPLEKKETFQPNGVQEILLLGTSLNHHHPSDATKLQATNHHHNLRDFEVLEGTTSNFFVIYNNNTIRTSQQGVLFGYVRHLVLIHAPKCGLRLDPRPCCLEDGLNGYWKETFITSSSRLIVPIQEILMPDYRSRRNAKKDGTIDKAQHGNNKHTGKQWKRFWMYEEDTKTIAKWELLLNEIKSHEG